MNLLNNFKYNKNINIITKITSEKFKDEKINVDVHYFLCEKLDEDIILLDHIPYPQYVHQVGNGGGFAVKQGMRIMPGEPFPFFSQWVCSEP